MHEQSPDLPAAHDDLGSRGVEQFETTENLELQYRITAPDAANDRGPVILTCFDGLFTLWLTACRTLG